jgi:hypothetical protein
MRLTEVKVILTPWIAIPHAPWSRHRWARRPVAWKGRAPPLPLGAVSNGAKNVQCVCTGIETDGQARVARLTAGRLMSNAVLDA